MSGKDKFKEVGEKIKAEVAEKEEKQLEAQEAAKNALDVIRNNADLAKMYADSASLGAENLGAQLPLLKIHAVGRSAKNELANGEEPHDGYFFYKPTQEEFSELTIHVLTISKGFRAEGLSEEGEEKREIFNQILGGVIVDNGEYKPFVMYFTGLKLSYLWEFGKEASAWTKRKVPMFALSVKLTTEKISHARSDKYGKAWIVKLEIVKDANGFPVLVTDPGEFSFLREHVTDVANTISSVIANKTKESNGVVEPVDEVYGEGEMQHPGAGDLPFD